MCGLAKMKCAGASAPSDGLLERGLRRPPSSPGLAPAGAIGWREISTRARASTFSAINPPVSIVAVVTELPKKSVSTLSDFGRGSMVSA